MLDSRVVDLRMLYTDDIPFPKSCQEPNVAGQYQEFLTFPIHELGEHSCGLQVEVP